jgi:hypothetical protein
VTAAVYSVHITRGRPFEAASIIAGYLVNREIICTRCATRAAAEDGLLLDVPVFVEQVAFDVCAQCFAPLYDAGERITEADVESDGLTDLFDFEDADDDRCCSRRENRWRPASWCGCQQ